MTDPTPEEQVNHVIEQSIEHIRNRFGQNEDLLDILVSLVDTYGEMAQEPDKYLTRRIPGTTLFPDLIAEVKLRIAAERARRSGQVH